MRTAWPTVRLSELLRRSDASRAIRADEIYNEITVRLWGRGVVLRRRAAGVEIASPRRYVARTDQLILSRIDARNGAIGVVPAALDGAVVSNDFPLFDVDATQALPRFLEWLTKTASFVDLCRSASEGTTNRVRLQEDRFLRLELALPPLPEQRRIVVMLDKVSAKVEEARDLRKEVASCSDLLMAAEERKLWPLNSLENAPTLAEVTRFLARGRQSEQGPSDHVLIKTQHVQQGRYVPSLVRLAPHVAQKVHTDAIAQEGDILVACSAAGCLGRVARYEGDGRPASTDTHVAIVRANPGVIDPDYLYAYLRGAQGQHELRSRERGDWRREKIGFRLTELNLKDLKSVPVPLPSRMDQRRVVQELSTFRRGTDSLKRLQDQTSAELEALIPSILDRAFNGEV